jgi:hypothetical protein
MVASITLADAPARLIRGGRNAHGTYGNRCRKMRRSGTPSCLSEGQFCIEKHPDRSSSNSCKAERYSADIKKYIQFRYMSACSGHDYFVDMILGKMLLKCAR